MNVATHPAVGIKSAQRLRAVAGERPAKLDDYAWHRGSGVKDGFHPVAAWPGR
ncbi:hypothetical protein HQ590_02845 [bacterium]|nr:hypothetical protein [bacterium]